jgi:hypothetical protein
MPLAVEANLLAVTGSCLKRAGYHEIIPGIYWNVEDANTEALGNQHGCEDGIQRIRYHNTIILYKTT